MAVQLDEYDFETLSEALDALASKDINSGLMMGMFSLALSKDKDEAKTAFDKEMEEAKTKSKNRKDTITMLRAKLIQMKREATVKELGDQLRHG